MFFKTVLVASTVGLATSSVAVSRGKEQGAKTKTKGETVDASTIDMSAVGKVTTGAWADEFHSSGCSSLSSQPIVDGYNLGKCQPSILGGASWNYDWCGWNADNSVLYVNELYYSSSNDCTGTLGFNLTTSYTGLTNGCKSSTKYQCGTTVAYSNYGSPQHSATYNSASCGGDEVAWDVFSYSSCTDDSGCITYTGTTYSSKGICDDADDVCFHVDTKIDYKGVAYTFEELKAGKEPECTVPHTPSSRGVVISTSCGKTVRVTDTHLMATTKGFQLAYSLKAGDVLFGDYSKEMCTVQSVEKEKSTQQYFGLNCVHSEVLASGLRASTFGDFHTLPSWYMTYVGGLVGSDTASYLGEYVAEWYFKK